MIKPTELRLGNWIWKYESGWDLKQVTASDIAELEAMPPHAEDMRFSPIILTPEVLERAGFYKQNDKHKSGFTQYCAKGMMLLVDDSETPFSNIEAYFERRLGIYECVGERPNLKLHELQNLYYTLVGKDLQINL